MGSFLTHIFNLLDSACTGEKLKQGKEKKNKEKKAWKGRTCRISLYEKIIFQDREKTVEWKIQRSIITE